MQFDITHVTTYRYDPAVCLGDHLLRLMPRTEQLIESSVFLSITPTPAWRRDEIDGNGNPVVRVGFGPATEILQIESRIHCTTAQPPDLPGWLPPLPWPPENMPAYQQEQIDAEVRAFSDEIAARSGWEALTFLEQLNQTLYATIIRHIRHAGDAQSALETLRLGTGACRDLTVLFMTACRAQGIPARFVSGYQAHADATDGGRHMHAWPEVWLQGHGWVGFDPTHGTMTSDGHLAVAVAPSQIDTMPVEGGFYGAGGIATLDYTLRIRTL